MWPINVIVNTQSYVGLLATVSRFLLPDFANLLLTSFPQMGMDVTQQEIRHRIDLIRAIEAHLKTLAEQVTSFSLP